MSSQLSECSGHGCDCYQRGAADARRTVEAEFAAERAVLAMLASSLADTGDHAPILAYPADAGHIDPCGGSPIEAGSTLRLGSVDTIGDTGAKAHRF